MKLTYLGTAAAEGWPAVYCNCEHCVRARNAGGRNIRTRSQALINRDLLIDYPADTYYHSLLFGVDLSAVENIIVTHSHDDHFRPIDMFYRSNTCFCHNRTVDECNIYGSEDVVKLYDECVRTIGPDGEEHTGNHMHWLPMYTPTKIGKYTVTALRANHAAPLKAYVYIVRDEKSTLLYLHDTGRLYDEVYDYLIENRMRADLVSLDCTYGGIPSGGGHMGLDSNIIERDKLAEKHIIDKNTKLVINHFSHNGKLIYDELVPVAEKEGFITSYDGMEIEF